MSHLTLIKGYRQSAAAPHCSIKTPSAFAQNTSRRHAKRLAQDLITMTREAVALSRNRQPTSRPQLSIYDRNQIAAGLALAMLESQFEHLEGPKNLSAPAGVVVRGLAMIIAQLE